MSLFTKLQNDKIKLLKNNSDKLSKLVKQHCTISDTHLSDIN